MPDVTEDKLQELRLSRSEWDELSDAERDALLTEEDASAHQSYDDDDLDALDQVASDPADDKDATPKQGGETPPPPPPPVEPPEPREFVAVPTLPTKAEVDAQVAAFEKRAAELKARDDALEAQLNQIEEALEAGDKTSVEAMREQRKINAQIRQVSEDRAQLETDRRIAQAQIESAQREANSVMAQRFEFAKDAFFESDTAAPLYGHAELGARAKAVLLQFVPTLASDPVNATRSFAWFLKEADRRVRAFMVDDIAAAGIGGKAPPPPPANDKTKPPARTPNLKDVPQTLAKVPAADNEQPAGEFAHLDSLGGAKLIAAIEAMTPAQRARYEAQE